MERAYKCGFQDANNNAAAVPLQRPEEGAIAWELIPPRPRHAFWRCCLHILGEHGNGGRRGYLTPETTERLTPGWKLVVEGASYLGKEKAFGDKTIAPLLKLGLLIASDNVPECLILADRARKTWLLFQARGGRFPDSPLTP